MNGAHSALDVSGVVLRSKALTAKRRHESTLRTSGSLVQMTALNVLVASSKYVFWGGTGRHSGGSFAQLGSLAPVEMK